MKISHWHHQSASTDTAAMFPFFHQSFPPLRTASSVSMRCQQSPDSLLWNIAASCTFIEQQAAESSGVWSWLLCNSALEINDQCSEAVNQGGLCGMRISLRDQCTINSFTANTRSWNKYTLLSIEEEGWVRDCTQYVTVKQSNRYSIKDQSCAAAFLNCIHLSTSA